MSDTARAKSQIWRYDAGQWTQVPEPYEWDGMGDYVEALRQAGFRGSDHWGCDGCVLVDIYEHHQDERWLIGYAPTGSIVHTIEVVRLPDLLDLLARIAPTATAGLLSQVTRELDNVIFTASEDAYQERERRLRPRR